MAELWESIRTAIKTKADTDVAALRMAQLGRRRPLGGLPQVFVHIPRVTLAESGRPQGHVERYTLTFPGTLDVSGAPGEQRADSSVLDLARQLFVAWRSGIALGLGASGVVGSWLSDMSPDHGDSDQLLGYDLTWIVDVHEILATGRTL